MGNTRVSFDRMSNGMPEIEFSPLPAFPVVLVYNACLYADGIIHDFLYDPGVKLSRFFTVFFEIRK